MGFGPYITAITAAARVVDALLFPIIRFETIGSSR
jgi:hypothetical protein